MQNSALWLTLALSSLDADRITLTTFPPSMPQCSSMRCHPLNSGLQYIPIYAQMNKYSSPVAGNVIFHYLNTCYTQPRGVKRWFLVHTTMVIAIVDCIVTMLASFLWYDEIELKISFLGFVIDLKRKSRHADKFVITGRYKNDSFRCSHWRQFHQCDKLFHGIYRVLLKIVWLCNKYARGYLSFQCVTYYVFHRIYRWWGIFSIFR